MVRVLLFGRLADIAGWRTREISPAPARVSALRALICGADEALAAALHGPGVRIAVDKALVSGDVELASGAEVAFMPPMSGG